MDHYQWKTVLSVLQQEENIVFLISQQEINFKDKLYNLFAANLWDKQKL